MNVFYFEWEKELLMWFQSIHNSVCDVLMPFFTFLGNSGWLPILVALLLLFVYRKDRRVGWTCVLGLVVSFLLCNLILKNVIGRARPCQIWTDIPLLAEIPKDSSFPSGHTNASFTVAAAIFSRNKKWGIVGLVVAALIAISRMYLFMHFPTDVLGGICTGVLGATVSFFFVNWAYEKSGREVDSLRLF